MLHAAKTTLTSMTKRFCYQLIIISTHTMIALILLLTKLIVLLSGNASTMQDHTTDDYTNSIIINGYRLKVQFLSKFTYCSFLGHWFALVLGHTWCRMNHIASCQTFAYEGI